MKKLNLIIFIYILNIFFLSNTFAVNSKIAFIDFNTVLENSDKGKKVLDELNLLNQKNIEDLKSKEASLKKKEEELIKKKNLISNEAFNKELNELKNKIKKFREDKNSMVKNFNDKKNKNINTFIKSIDPIIKDYMKTESIEMLIERKNIVIGDKKLDITQDIIKKINLELN